MSLRYLWGAEGQSEGRSFLRFITYVAIGGVALGVAALLLALAIVRGFSREIENKIVGFGAFVEIMPNKDGLLHISEIDHGYVEEVEDYLSVGDRIEVKLLEVRGDGKLRLSRKPLLDEEGQEE
ncbi:MAG: hypothetical protein BRD41_01845 [Bacteroidetes bacterium QS_1_63_11]|nr:MAG: hypothetical protein BRD41_01845 [Bacteroidetes bacterium QS_1_63_11]